jgi:hypothetical protein
MCQQLFPFPFLLSLISRQVNKVQVDKKPPPTSPLKGEATIWMDKSYPLGEDLGGDFLLYAPFQPPP